MNRAIAKRLLATVWRHRVLPASASYFRRVGVGATYKTSAFNIQVRFRAFNTHQRHTIAEQDSSTADEPEPEEPCQRLREIIEVSGHSCWGFVIYRCTYSDDSAWSDLMARLKESICSQLTYGCAEDLMDSLALTVFEDPSLDGASKADVRERFKQWVASPEAGAERVRADALPIVSGSVETTPRFNYCIHVDEGALRSVVGGGQPLSEADRPVVGYVNIIDGSWQWPDAADQIERGYSPEDPYNEHEPPLEGCRLHDVGWLRMSFIDVLPSAYEDLDPYTWEDHYSRPPLIVPPFAGCLYQLVPGL